MNKLKLTNALKDKIRLLHRSFFVALILIILTNQNITLAQNKKSTKSKNNPSQQMDKKTPTESNTTNSKVEPNNPTNGSSSTSTNDSTVSAPIPNENSDKIDVENLEKKYWSSKDDDFTVVQNRSFTKVNSFYFSFITGKIVNDGFLEGTLNSLSLGYFFTEKFGINLDNTVYNTKENSITKSFDGQYGVKPAYNSLLATNSLRLMWSPIYAKVSLLEKKILYLDIALGFHVGNTKYKMMSLSGGRTNQTSHYGFDISQLLFINKTIAFRFDIRNTWTSQKQIKYHNDTDLGTTRFQDNAWLLGVNIFFGGKDR